MPPHATSHIPAIDGLRAIAVLAVIIFHADFLEWLPGGFTGVDVFFVISGFVISQSLHSRQHLGFADYLLDFYRRRFLRILPALLLVLAASFVLSALFVPPIWLSNQNDDTGLAAIFGLSNFVLAGNANPYFSPRAELNPYLHTWSLGVEEQFYLLFPAIYFLYLRCRKILLIARVILPLLAMASLVFSFVQTANAPLNAFYLLPSRFWELAAGAMLFQLIGRLTPGTRSGRHAPIILALGLAMTLAGFLFAERQGFPFPWALLPVGGTLLLITAVVAMPGKARSPLHALLQSSLLTYVGRLSFSLYLWHWPVLVLLRWTVGLEMLAVQLAYPVLVLALAAASYHWVETPLRRSPALLHRPGWVPLAAGGAAILLCWGGARWVVENNERLSLSRVSDTYTWHAYKHYPRESIERSEAPWLQGRQLFVIGDSHTAAYRTLLNITSLKLGINVIEHERGGCGVARLIAADPAECAEQREAALAAIEADAKPGDIVFLASLRMPELAGRDWRSDTKTTLAQAQAELTLAAIEQGRRDAAAVIARLQARGLTVLIDAPKPLFKAPPNRCSDIFNQMNPVCAPGLTLERQPLEALRAPQMQTLQHLRQQFPGLEVWDPLPLLCPGATCSAYDDNGEPMFSDADHLSGHGNRVLEPAFTKRVMSIWQGTEG